jgi:hypothetical protein
MGRLIIIKEPQKWQVKEEGLESCTSLSTAEIEAGAKAENQH